jgi:hypothetical protein
MQESSRAIRIDHSASSSSPSTSNHPVGVPVRHDPGLGLRQRLSQARNLVRRRSGRSQMLDHLATQVADLTAQLDQLGAAHHDTWANATTARHAANNQAAVIHDHAHRLVALERYATIQTVTAWVRNTEVAPSMLVSVIVPTRDRAKPLSRAIASVQAQCYDHWQLLVIDDGSTDTTAELLHAQADTEHRLHTLRTDGVGPGAARNAGLDAAVGDVVVYLDDDNMFDPLWLKAVVWAFTQHPEVDVVYGARVIDDIARVLGTGAGALPTIQFEPFDRRTLERANTVDMGVIAHRTGLTEARFDPELITHADWDLFLRLTENRSLLELPVVACYYTSDSPNRLSNLDRCDADRVRAKLTGTGSQLP